MTKMYVTFVLSHFYS